MSPDLSLTLQITLVGMGLVFGAIILLWGIMALLVRMTSEREKVRVPDTAQDQARIQAAAAAVALALAEEADRSHLREFPLPPTAVVSAWQAVMRTKMLNKRGQIR